MPIWENVGGAWKKVKTLWTTSGGTTTKVRRAYVNINGTWTQMYSNLDFKVYSLGLAETATPYANKGLWVNGAQVFNAGRSYNVVTFDKYGNLAAQRTFDVYGDAQTNPATTTNGDAMASFLNGLATGTAFVIFTSDEPSGGRSTNLKNAMYRVGATAAIFGGTINFRAAYLLMGIVGSAAVVELAQGSDQKDSSGNSVGAANSAIEYTFNFTENAFSNVSRVI